MGGHGIGKPLRHAPVSLRRCASGMPLRAFTGAATVTWKTTKFERCAGMARIGHAGRAGSASSRACRAKNIAASLRMPITRPISQNAKNGTKATLSISTRAPTS